jgi:hypothetical protein
MPPKKRPGKELPTEGSSQAIEEQAPTTAQTTIQVTHIPQSLHPQPATNPIDQPATQMEVLVSNTAASNTMPQPPHRNQTITTLEDLQQDSEEEIKAIIEDELALLCQENEHLCLMQEHLVRRKAMVKRPQVMQQQIKQERATQADLQ